MTRSNLRLLLEFAVPAMSVGAIAGLCAAGLAALAGQPAGWALAIGLGLGAPLAVFGAGCATLQALGKIPTGVFGPMAVYWLVAFPLSMLSHEAVMEWAFTGTPGLPAEPLWQFLAYNALLSAGFAIGFMYVQEQVGRLYWPRVRDHNQYAYAAVEAYKGTALALHQRKEAVRANRAMRRKKRAAQARGV